MKILNILKMYRERRFNYYLTFELIEMLNFVFLIETVYLLYSAVNIVINCNVIEIQSNNIFFCASVTLNSYEPAQA